MRATEAWPEAWPVGLHSIMIQGTLVATYTCLQPLTRISCQLSTCLWISTCRSRHPHHALPRQSTCMCLSARCFLRRSFSAYLTSMLHAKDVQGKARAWCRAPDMVCPTLSPTLSLALTLTLDSGIKVLTGSRCGRDAFRNKPRPDPNPGPDSNHKPKHEPNL